MDRQPLQNRALAFVPGKVKHTKAPGVRLRLWGRGAWGGDLGQRRKSHNKLEKKPATSRYSPSANGKGTKNSTSSRASRSPDTRKGPVTSHRGRGGVGAGCLVRLWRAKTPGGSSSSPGQRSSELHPVPFALGRLPSARCSPYLGPPAAFVQPAPALPACRGRRSGGGGERGSPRPCPRVGGARGDRGGAAGQLPRQRAGDLRPGRWDQRGTGDCPISPAGGKGPPLQAP